MDEVCVLMSTYNGEKYLEEQIDTIIAQKGVKIHLLVRDDGSTDGTVNILKKYRNKNFLKFYCGNNIGPAKSYIDLLFNAEKYKYYAFADQDDFWLNDKLYRAVSMLNSIKLRPAFYNSKAIVVDKNLNKIGSEYGTLKVYNLQTQICRSSVIGCTMVINNELLQIIKMYRPERLCMHDQWIAILCKVYDGVEVKDDQSKILYRQHSNNVMGASSSLKKSYRASSLKLDNGRRSAQALELFDIYKKDMPLDSYNLLTEITQYKSNMQYWSKCVLRKYNAERYLYNFLIRLSFFRGKF